MSALIAATVVGAFLIVCLFVLNIPTTVGEGLIYIKEEEENDPQ